MFEASGATPPANLPDAVGSGESLWGRLRDHLPVSLQARLSFGPLHLSAVLVAIALVLFVLSWWVIRSGPRGEAIPTPSSAVSPVAVQSVAPTATASPAEVVVDVAGKVRRPGVYHLPLGSRVIDALEAAGGARPHIDLTQVNLARLLTDGEQILLLRSSARATPSSAGTGTGPSGGLININRADQSLLETLPGVGPVTAAAIVTWREQNGRFSSIEGLVDVSGIGDATLERLRPYITV